MLLKGLIFAYLLARLVGPEGFGEYYVGLSLVGVAGAIVAMGLDPVLQRELAALPTGSLRAAFHAGALIRLSVWLGLLPVLWVALHSGVLSDVPVELVLCLYLSQLAIVVGITQIDLRFQGFGVVIAKSTVLAGACALLGIVVGFAFEFGLLYFGSIYSGEQLLRGLLLRRASRNEVQQGNLDGVADLAKRLLFPGLQMAVIAVLVAIYARVDQVMLASMRSVEEAGLYSASARLLELGAMFPILLIHGVGPLLYQENRSRSVPAKRAWALFLKLGGFLLLWSMIVVMCYAGFPAPLLRMLFGEEFVAGSVFLAWLAPCVLPLVLIPLVSVMANSTGSAFCLIVGSVVGCATNVILNLILIPEQGGVGAAIASLISYLIVIVLQGLSLWMHYRNKVHECREEQSHPKRLPIEL